MRHTTPQAAEQLARQRLKERVQEVARVLWKGCEVKTFGSSATGLNLAGSDVDMAILGTGVKASTCGDFDRAQKTTVQQQLSSLLRALEQNGVAISSEAVLTARVPIIKFSSNIWITDVVPPRAVSLPCDVSIGSENGPKAVLWICRQVQRHTLLRPLCVLLKCVLKKWSLNEPRHGGVGGYLLVALLVGYLQHEGDALQDSGDALRGFLRYYQSFDYGILAIAPATDNGVRAKTELTFRGSPPYLAVEDPQQEGRDIGGTAYAFRDVKAAFKRLLDLLVPENTLDEAIEQSVLRTQTIPQADYLLYQQQMMWQQQRNTNLILQQQMVQQQQQAFLQRQQMMTFPQQHALRHSQLKMQGMQQTVQQQKVLLQQTKQVMTLPQQHALRQSQLKIQEMQRLSTLPTLHRQWNF